MKLHLPKGLRTALLAVFALTATSYSAQAAAPAAYDYLVQSTDKYYEVLEGEAKTAITAPSMTSSWVMSISGKFNPYNVDDGEFAGGSIVFGNVDVPFYSNDIRGDKVRKPKGIQDNQFAIVFSEGQWTLQAVTSSGVKKLTNKGDIEINYANRPHIQVTLNWVYNEDTQTGSLYFTGASLVNFQYQYGTESYDPTGVTVIPTETLTTNRIEILKDVALTDDMVNELGGFWGATVTDAFGTSEMATTTYSKGSGSDPMAWLITGTADVEKLLNGGYGSAPADATVQFTGSNGALFLYTPEDHDATTGLYEVSYSSNTTVANNILEGDVGMAVAFGAEEGSRLTVKNDALTNILALGTPISIMGDGTVKLEMAGNTSLKLAELSAGGDLEIKSDGNFFQMDLSGTKVGTNASIIRTDDSSTASFTVIVDNGETSANLNLNKLANGNGALMITGSTGSSVVQAKEIEATGNITSYVKLIADTITATGGEVSAGEYGDISGSIQANEIIADSVYAGGIIIEKNASNSDAILEGKVSMNTAGIQADTIGENVTISFDTYAAEVGTLITNSMTGADISGYITDAATDSMAIITQEGMAASGKLTADSINLNQSYNLTAAAIEAGSIQDGGTEITSDGTAVLKNASFYTDSNDKRVLSASSIEAKSVTIGADQILLGADITTTEGVSVGSNASVTDVTIAAGTSTTVGDNASLKNVTIAEGEFKNSATATLDNVTIQTANTGDATTSTSFGGSNADAVSVTNDVESVQVSGTFEGSKLTVDKLVLNADGLDFDNISTGGTEYSFISGEDLEYEYDASRDQLNIKSFVRAELATTTDGNGNTIITIKGQEDEAGITAELSDSHNRTVAIAAMQEALEGAPSTFAARATTSTPLAEIYEYVGHVNRYSNTERQNILSAASGASLAVLADAQRRGLRDAQDNLRNRIIQMGGGTNAGLTTDWEYAGIQAWAQADGSSASTTGKGDEWGYDYDTTGATVGANLDLTANTVVGLSFSASYADIKVDSTDYAKGTDNAQYISFFARHQKERWVQMFIFTYGHNDIEMERNVLGYTSKGNTTGTSLSAYYEVGYTFGLDYEYTHILQPLASISFTSASIDAFEEAGSIGDAGIAYENNDYTYAQVALGVRYQGVLYQTVHERNAVVEARALVTQDFGDTTDEAKVAFRNSASYKVKTADSSGTGYKLGAGISIPVEQHTTLYADVDYTYAPDYSGFRADIGVRYDF